MKAWTVAEYGHFAKVLALQDIAEPEPEGAAALIRVGAAGLSFSLLLRIAGRYQHKDPLPFVPGVDAAGEVLAAGPECPFAPGTRIMGRALSGALAEQALMDSAACRPVPAGMADASAAAFLNAYETSYVGLALQGRLREGETLLVHGGAGGVGLAAIQIGRALGARVIATASGAEKLAVCRREGAELAIDYSQEDFVQAVLDHSGGRGADVIYDPVGGDVFDRSRRCIAFNGRLVVVGFASGRIPEMPANRVLLRTFYLTGFTLDAYQRHRPDLLASARQALETLYREDRIAPVVHARLPMERLVEGLEMIESRRVIGKVVLAPNGGE